MMMMILDGKMCGISTSANYACLSLCCRGMHGEAEKMETDSLFAIKTLMIRQDDRLPAYLLSIQKIAEM